MEEFIAVVVRMVLTYLIIFTIFRLMGKREIGELSIMDLVVFILLAEIAVLSVENTDKSFLLTITPMFILLIIQRTTARLSLKSVWFRTFLDGKPSIIIRRGKIDEKEMKKQRYNFDDLLVQIREKGISDVKDVELAVLETNGKLSVFKKEDQPPMTIDPLIIDGQVQKKAMEKLELDEETLKQRLKKKGITSIEEVSLAQLKHDGSLSIDIKSID